MCLLNLSTIHRIIWTKWIWHFFFCEWRINGRSIKMLVRLQSHSKEKKTWLLQSSSMFRWISHFTHDESMKMFQIRYNLFDFATVGVTQKCKITIEPTEICLAQLLLLLMFFSSSVFWFSYPICLLHGIVITWQKFAFNYWHASLLFFFFFD